MQLWPRTILANLGKHNFSISSFPQWHMKANACLCTSLTIPPRLGQKCFISHSQHLHASTRLVLGLVLAYPGFKTALCVCDSSTLHPPQTMLLKGLVQPSVLSNSAQLNLGINKVIIKRSLLNIFRVPFQLPASLLPF